MISNLLVFIDATRFVVFIAIFSLFLPNVTSNKNNFNSVHKTKEAGTKVNELFCFTCDMMFDGEDCLNINQTRTKQTNLTRKCSEKELFCSVKRFSYTMSDKNTTSDKKLWNVQRNCSESCDNSCIIIGERTKLYACQTCCDNNLCNVGAGGERNGMSAMVLLVFMGLIGGLGR